MKLPLNIKIILVLIATSFIRLQFFPDLLIHQDKIYSVTHELPITQEYTAQFNGLTGFKVLAKDKWLEINFPLETKSKNNKFTFSLPQPDSSEELLIQASKVNVLLEDRTWLGEEEIEGDVVFQPIYYLSINQIIRYYLNRIGFSKPWFMNKYILAASLFLYAFLMVKLFIQLSKKTN